MPIELPDQSQWLRDLFSETEVKGGQAPELPEDWISGKYVYTLVFWSRSTAAAAERSQMQSQEQLQELGRLFKPPSL